jgi:hypothetical protein
VREIPRMFSANDLRVACPSSIQLRLFIFPRRQRGRQLISQLFVTRYSYADFKSKQHFIAAAL